MQTPKFLRVAQYLALGSFVGALACSSSQQSGSGEEVVSRSSGSEQGADAGAVAAIEPSADAGGVGTVADGQPCTPNADGTARQEQGNAANNANMTCTCNSGTWACMDLRVVEGPLPPPELSA